MITGCLQQKNGFYYAVLYLKVNGRRRCKWVPMRLPVEGTSARKAQKAFDEIRLQYEREEEERLDREAKAKELAENTHPDALLPFTEYMEKWLQSTRSSLATATYQSYSNMMLSPFFSLPAACASHRAMGIEAAEVLAYLSTFTHTFSMGSFKRLAALVMMRRLA